MTTNNQPDLPTQQEGELDTSHSHKWVLRSSREATRMDNEDMVAGDWKLNDRQIYIFSEWVCDCGAFKLVTHYFDQEESAHLQTPPDRIAQLEAMKGEK